jgi:hypothetical protein
MSSTFSNEASVAGDAPSGSQLPSLYRGLLGKAFDDLPEKVKRLHDARSCVLQGIADIDRGRSPLARLVAMMFRFPEPGRGVPMQVEVQANGDGKIWKRTYGARTFASAFAAGKGRDEGLLLERFGPIGFALAPVVADGELKLVLRRWKAFGIPLPLVMGPRAQASEREEDGQLKFDVRLSHPLTGLIVHYRGTIDGP